MPKHMGLIQTVHKANEKNSDDPFDMNEIDDLKF